MQKIRKNYRAGFSVTIPISAVIRRKGVTLKFEKNDFSWKSVSPMSNLTYHVDFFQKYQKLPKTAILKHGVTHIGM